MSRLVSRPADSALSETSIDIEAIVRRVLMQLQQSKDNAMLSSDAESSNQTESISFDAGVCSLDDVRLMTVSTKQLHLSPRTVITPAARDELRHRGITVVKLAAMPDAEINQAPRQPGTRSIHLQRDGIVADHLFAAVKRQILSRGVRLCNQSDVEVILSSRPATTAHHWSGTNRCVVAINRIDDVPRFMIELSPNVFVLDIAHLHLVALASCITAIAKPTSRSLSKAPTITVAGGLS